MNVHELVRGFSYWMAPHPAWEPTEDWPEEVLCVYYESSDGIVLIDPLLPRGQEAEFCRSLDADVERLGQPVRVLLTAPCHARDTAAVVDRYAASVWAPPRARWKGPVLTTTDDLPTGVEALLPDGDENQALFFLRDHQTLVTGDIFSGTGGRVHVFVDEQDREPFLAWLPRLSDLPFEACPDRARRASVVWRCGASPRGGRGGARSSRIALRDIPAHWRGAVSPYQALG